MGKIVPVKLCANEYCERGPGGTRNWVDSDKPWGKYCCTKCGDCVRRLRYYYKGKAGTEAPTVYEYGPLNFLPGLTQEGWVNFKIVEGGRRISLWVRDTGGSIRQKIFDILKGLQDAYLNPEEFMEKAGPDPDRQQEGRNLVTAAKEIGIPILEAAKLV